MEEGRSEATKEHTISLGPDVVGMADVFIAATKKLMRCDPHKLIS